MLIVRSLHKLLRQGAEGIVVLHGTDTMAWSAQACSFYLNDTPVPIIFTGSNKVISEPDSDASWNVECAYRALKRLDRGVYIVFAGAPALPGIIYQGTRVRKLRASGQAFVSVNSPPLGQISEREISLNYTPFPMAGLVSSLNHTPKVLYRPIYPGIDWSGLGDTLLQGDYKGLVLELYPALTVSNGLRELLKTAREAGILTVGTVRALWQGEVKLYESIEHCGEDFFLPSSPECATVKVMWAIAQADGRGEQYKLLKTECAGEFSRGE
jgi:glutamyl-tRNA(Gln) amidotransferase subunit D